MSLLDTNLLARITDSADPQCATSRRAVHVLLARRERLMIVPQNLFEFWAVATRAPGPPPGGQNGLGMTCQQASQWLQFFQRRFTLLSPPPPLLKGWEALGPHVSIKGFKSHRAPPRAPMPNFWISPVLSL